MAKPESSLDDSTRRNFRRLPLGIAARLETLHGRISVRLVDLSQGGAQVLVPAVDFRIRDGVLMWRGFEYYGRVAWREEGKLGLVFSKPIPLSVLVTMRDFAPSIIREESMTDEMSARAFVDGSMHLGADR